MNDGLSNTFHGQSLRALAGIGRLRGLNDAARLHAVALILSACFIAALLLSLPLWIQNRPLPTVPVWGNAPLPAPLGMMGLGIMLLGAALLPFWRNAQWAALAIVGTGCLMALADMNRAHPWFLHYLLSFAALYFFYRRNQDASGVAKTAADNKRAIMILRLLMVIIYFWSGVHKFNLNFQTLVAPWMWQPFFPDPSEMPAIVRWSMQVIGPVETAIALGLLIPWTRKLAVITALGTHAFILMSIGPLGHDWNHVVWPWNIAMMGWLLFLFWNSGDWSFFQMASLRKSILAILVVLIFGLLPVLHIWDKWPGYLSWSMYSGKVPDVYLQFESRQLPEMDPLIQELAIHSGAEVCFLYPNDYAMKTMGSPIFPSQRALLLAAQELCGEIPGTDNALIKYQYWESGKWNYQAFPCE